MKAPPPKPELCGSTSPSTACTATAASMAEPPRCSTFTPASTASGLAAATIACDVVADCSSRGASACAAASPAANRRAMAAIVAMERMGPGYGLRADPRASVRRMGNAGPRNLITDVPGLSVGQAHDARVRSGVTVILPDEGAIAAADVRGGAPGTRETDALAPQNLVEAIHAIVLSGGSVYGLAAADAVAVALGARGVGFRLAPTSNAPPSPIVPAAIIFDLANGGDKAWGEEPPYRRLAAEALANAGQSFALGTAGAGHGARAGGLKGGLGSASAVADDGIIVGAITAVNGSGGVTDQARRAFWAAPRLSPPRRTTGPPTAWRASARATPPSPAWRPTWRSTPRRPSAWRSWRRTASAAPSVRRTRPSTATSSSRSRRRACRCRRRRVSASRASARSPPTASPAPSRAASTRRPAGKARARQPGATCRAEALYTRGARFVALGQAGEREQGRWGSARRWAWQRRF